MIIGGDDFDEATVRLLFAPSGGNRSCAEFGIGDDDIAEPPEQFSVVFTSTGPAEVGAIDEASVTITDNDCELQ